MDIKRIVLESNNEEETDYFVSSDGRIFKEITPSKNGNGYAMVTIYKNGIGYTKSVHRIVAKAFLQKVKGKEYINHINGDKMDNRLENLEWCTPHENTEHYHKTLRNGKPMYNQKACLQIIDGEVIAESDRKIYLISYDGNPCYTITKQEWVETASGGHDQFYIDVYDLNTGELVEVPEHIKDVTNYMK